MHLHHPRQLSTGFTLVEIMIVIAIIGLLATIALPNFMRARQAAAAKTCITNLSNIESAKQIWGVEKGKTTGDEPTFSELVGPDLYIKRMPSCPAGGTFHINPIGDPASCTRFTEGHTL